MKESGEAKPRWAIREYRDGDEEQILELREATLGDPRNMQWWNWMYKNGPDGPATFWVAEAEGKIVGINPGLPLRIKVKDRVCRSILGFDIMTHPDYQRQGILNTLANIGTSYRVEHGFNLDHGTSTPQRFPVYQKLKITHKHIVVCQPPLMVKVINWGQVLKACLRIPVFLGKLLGYIWERLIIRTSSLPDTDIQVERISAFNEDIDEFWLKASELKDIMFVRDRKYLNWRYVEKPENEYAIFLARRQQEIVGFIVLKIVINNMKRGFIVDLLTLPDEDSVAEVLINRAVEYFRGEEADLLLCLMFQDTTYYRVLRKLGFTHRYSGIQLNVRVFDTDISKEFIGDSGNWYFVFGDTDTR